MKNLVTTRELNLLSNNNYMGINQVFNAVKNATVTPALDFIKGLSSDDSAINTRQFGDLNNKFLESGGFENTVDYLNSQYVKSQGNKNITLNLGDGESVTFNTNDMVPIDIRSGQINDTGSWNVFVGKHSDGTTKIIDINDLGYDEWSNSLSEDTISEHPLFSAGDKIIDLKEHKRKEHLRYGARQGKRYTGFLKTPNPVGTSKGSVKIKDVSEFEGLDTKLNDFGFYNN